MRHSTALILFLVSSFLIAATPQDKVRKDYSDIVERGQETKNFFSDAQFQRLFKHVANHSVAGLGAIGQFDHQPTGIGDTEIGFCFGRAMAVHLAARRMGMKNSEIRKVFIAGDLKDENVRWRFHMATVLKNHNDDWTVVDPIMPGEGQPGVLPLPQWLDTVKTNFDLTEGHVNSKLYLTDTRAIMADMGAIPATREIEIALRNLFGDRLIDTTFEATAEKGFDTVPRSEIDTPYIVFAPREAAQNKYFINFTEPDFLGKPLFNFDFFRFSTVIYYQHELTSPMMSIPRSYDYNDYFVKLVDSFRVDKPIPDIENE